MTDIDPSTSSCPVKKNDGNRSKLTNFKMPQSLKPPDKPNNATDLAPKTGDTAQSEDASTKLQVSRKFDLSRKIDRDKFKDIDGFGNPLKTLPNVEIMLNAYQIVVRYNVIKKDMDILIPEHQSCPDTVKNTSMTILVSLASLNGLYSGNFERFVHAIAANNQFNPVMQWIESKPWDGEDRLQALFNTIVSLEGFSSKLKETLIHKWLISAVAAASSNTGVSVRGVLTFQGAQSLGKTRWVARLISEPLLQGEVIKLDHFLDANNKDTIISATRHWLVEIGELDSSFKKDIARLKGFITNSKDKVRRPYDRLESEYARRTVFLATVNESHFLVDDTGNTRWWTIPCIEIEHNHTIDTQQLWAQVYHQFQHNSDSKQYWLTPEEEAELELNNQSHRTVSAIRDLIETNIDFTKPEYTTEAKSASEVLKYIGIDKPTNAQARECGAVLREKLGEPKKNRGYMVWMIPIAEDTNLTHHKFYSASNGNTPDDDDDEY